MKKNDRYKKLDDTGQNAKHQVRESPMTYDDYANMPDDGMRYELAAGILEMMSPAPHPRHQLVLHELANAMKDTCGMDYIVLFAPVDVILSDTEVRQPDLLMLHRSRLSLLTHRGIEGPPDLVVEILSPHSIKRDREDKRKSYAYYSVPEYWIVDMNNTLLEQYVLSGSEYILAEVYTGATPIRSEKIRCVSFTMKDIFAAISDIPN